MPPSNKPLVKKLAPDSAVWPFSALRDHCRSFPTRTDQDSTTVERAAESRDSLHISAASWQAQTEEDEWGAWVDARDGSHPSTPENERREKDEWAAWAEDTATPPDVVSDSGSGLEQATVSQSSRRPMREIHEQETSPWDAEESSSSFVSLGLENLIESNGGPNDLHSNPWDDGADRKVRHMTYPPRFTTGVQEGREQRRVRKTSRVMVGSISDPRRDDEQSIQFNPWNDG